MKQKLTVPFQFSTLFIPFRKKHSFHFCDFQVPHSRSAVGRVPCSFAEAYPFMRKEPGDLQLKVKAYKGILLHRG